MKFRIYRDLAGAYRARLYDDGEQTLLKSEGLKAKATAFDLVAMIMKHAPDASVEDLTDTH